MISDMIPISNIIYDITYNNVYDIAYGNVSDTVSNVVSNVIIFNRDLHIVTVTTLHSHCDCNDYLNVATKSS